MRARDVARDLHATDKISSRTRWRRTRSGRGWSKKNAAVASSTFSRNCCHVSPSVKMFSVRHSAQYPPSASWTTSNTNSAIPTMIRHGISRARFINPHKSSSRRESQFRDSSHDAPSTSPPTASVVLPAGLPASIQTPHIRSRKWLVAREVMSSDRNRLQSLVDALRDTEVQAAISFLAELGEQEIIDAESAAKLDLARTEPGDDVPLQEVRRRLGL